MPARPDDLPASKRKANFGFADSGRQTGSRHRKLEYFFHEALSSIPALRPYMIHDELTRLFPDKALLDVADHRFGLTKFVEEGNCEIRVRTSPQSRFVKSWFDETGKVKPHPKQAWFDVSWEGKELEVVLIHALGDGEEGRGVSWTYILADTPEMADAFFSTVCRWNSETREEILVYDGYHWSKNKPLAAAIKAAKFDDLVLKSGMRGQIMHDITWFFEAKAIYESYAAPWKRGILLTGPPGNGKTHTVKSLVNAVDRQCLYVQTFHGGESDVQDVFDEAPEEIALHADYRGHRLPGNRA